MYKMYNRVMGQHGVGVDGDSAVDHVEQPIAAEETGCVDQTTKFNRYQNGH